MDAEKLFTVLMDQVRRPLMGFIYSLVHNMDDAEDIFQKTSIVMWKKFESFERDTDFVSWACGCARFEVLNFLRSKPNRQRYFSDEYLTDVDQSYDEHERDRMEQRRRVLSACVDKLVERDRKLIRQCYSGRSTIKQAAVEIGRPAKTVYDSLRRIRRTLLSCIERTLVAEER